MSFKLYIFFAQHVHMQYPTTTTTALCSLLYLILREMVLELCSDVLFNCLNLSVIMQISSWNLVLGILTEMTRLVPYSEIKYACFTILFRSVI